MSTTTTNPAPVKRVPVVCRNCGGKTFDNDHRRCQIKMVARTPVGPVAFMLGAFPFTFIGMPIVYALLSFLGWQIAVILTGLLYVGLFKAVHFWQRRWEESYNLQMAMRDLIGLPTYVNRRVWRVQGWNGAEPAVVKFRVDPRKPLVDVKVLDELRACFGYSVQAKNGVTYERLAGPWHRLTAPIGEPAPVDPSAPVVDLQAREHTINHMKGAVSSVIDPAVEVVAETWHDNNRPASGVITYPSTATHKASTAQTDVTARLTDAVAPYDENGRWVVKWEPQNARFVFHDEIDPLSPIVGLAPVIPISQGGPDLKAGPVMGVTEFGEPWRLPIFENHILVVGESNSGKGSVFWNIIRAVMPMVHAGTCRLYIGDPKGGVELGGIEPFAHMYAEEPAQILTMLEQAVEDMDDQSKRIKNLRAGRKLPEPTVENPLCIVMVDEILDAYKADKSKKTVENVTRILAKGRALGFVMVVGSQSVLVEAIPNRDMFISTVCLKMKNKDHVDKALGAGMRDSAPADLIPKTLKGVAYVIKEDKPEPVRVRAAFVDDDEIDELTGAAHVKRMNNL